MFGGGFKACKPEEEKNKWQKHKIGQYWNNECFWEAHFGGPFLILLNTVISAYRSLWIGCFDVGVCQSVTQFWGLFVFICSSWLVIKLFLVFCVFFCCGCCCCFGVSLAYLLLFWSVVLFVLKQVWDFNNIENKNDIREVHRQEENNKDEKEREGPPQNNRIMVMRWIKRYVSSLYLFFVFSVRMLVTFVCLLVVLFVLFTSLLLMWLLLLLLFC